MRAPVVAALAFACACGGAAAPSQTPASDQSTAPSNVAAPEAPQSTTTGGARTPEVSAARSELDRAETQLGTAPGDCAAACRALASMERAAAHLCELDSGAECGRARERVEAARERVRASCGGCGT